MTKTPRIELEIKQVIARLRKRSYLCHECGCFISDDTLEEELLELINWRDTSIEASKEIKERQH